MNRLGMLIVATLPLLGAATHETEIDHHFIANRIDCETQMSDVPRSSKAWNDVTHRWTDGDKLEVVFWDAEIATLVIDDSSSRVLLSDDQLELRYSFEEVNYGPGEPTHGCSVPVKITFVVEVLVRKPYTLTAERRLGPPIHVKIGT